MYNNQHDDDESEGPSASQVSASMAVVDHIELAGSDARAGLVWSGTSEDLNTNLLIFRRGNGVQEHVNAEVDVLLVGVPGRGIVTIGGPDHTAEAGQAILAPKGAPHNGDERTGCLSDPPPPASRVEAQLQQAVMLMTGR